MRDAGYTCEFDLTNSPFRLKHANNFAQITYLKLIGKKTAIYNDNEHICFDIRIVPKKAFENINLRIELRYGDDSPVGTSPISALGRFEENISRTFQVDFNPIGLTKGKYRVDLVLFEVDEFGNSYDLDLLLPAFRFEVEDSADIVWNTSAWGHIRFPNASSLPVAE